MKLSFSTKGWHGKDFNTFLDLAKDLRFAGIELHNIQNPLFTASDSPFAPHATAATLRKLYEMQLSIPCIDCLCDPADPDGEQKAKDEVSAVISYAGNLRIP